MHRRQFDGLVVDDDLELDRLALDAADGARIEVDVTGVGVLRGPAASRPEDVSEQVPKRAAKSRGRNR